MRILKHKMDRSEDSHAILDAESRKKKASKIAAIVSQRTDLAKAEVLDIGTGSGHIAAGLSAYTKAITSVDVVDERKVEQGYDFVLVEDEKLPFKDRTFDVVISNHIVEHAPNQDLHLKEAMRVLKAGGILYLATPNKFWLTDPHYKLPFISWMPRRVSNAYLKLIQGAEWDIYPLSQRGIANRMSPYRIHNELPFLIRSSGNKNLDTSSGVTKLLRILPKQLDDLSKYYSPTLIFTVQRRYHK